MGAVNFKYSEAICYSGFRDGQSPETGIFPTYEEIKEDLLILQGQWKYLRLYDCDAHSVTVLEVIKKEGLDFKIMLGAYIVAEVSNENCEWGGVYTDQEIEANKIVNLKRIQKLIKLANAYPEIIFSLSAGNEATVEWTDHLVPVESVIRYVQLIQRECKQPVTFCENYLPWLGKLKPLAEVVDFISIHTYPVWEYKGIHEAMSYTLENYHAVADAYPDKTVVITEAGWATNSNGRGIDPSNVNEELQATYYNQLVEWSKKEQVITFVFEAFDENWKGSDEVLEPEKHWGLFHVDRSPKLVMQKIGAA